LGELLKGEREIRGRGGVKRWNTEKKIPGEKI